jgi:hypothetical protein
MWSKNTKGPTLRHLADGSGRRIGCAFVVFGARADDQEWHVHGAFQAERVMPEA